MTNIEILKQAISKAVQNGWGYEQLPHYDLQKKMGSNIRNIKVGRNLCIIGTTLQGKPKTLCGWFDVIFSHSFAKAFWGDVKYRYAPNGEVCGYENYGWKEELQNMVQYENPLEYLEKFL